jgi:hypothetical protein
MEMEGAYLQTDDDKREDWYAERVGCRHRMHASQTCATDARFRSPSPYEASRQGPPNKGILSTAGGSGGAGRDVCVKSKVQELQNADVGREELR